RALHSRRADARPVDARAPGPAWSVMQRIDHPDPAAANAEALHELANVATGLTLAFAGAVGGYGLAPSEAALARTLAGIRLDAIALALDLQSQSTDAGRWLAAFAKRRGVAGADIRFGFDPIGAAAVAGHSELGWSALIASFNAT